MSDFSITAAIAASVDHASVHRAAQEIQRGIGSGVRANIGLSVDPLQAARLQSQMRAVTSQALSASSGTNSLATSLRSVGTAATAAGSSLNTFANVVGLSARRFAAFGAASTSIIALAAGIRNLVSQSVQFEHQLTRLSQTGESTRAELKGIADEVTRLATGYGVSSNGLAKIAVDLKQVGLNAGDTKSLLEGIALTSRSPSFGNLGASLKSVVVSLQSFRVPAKEVADVLSSITNVAADTAVSSEDLAKSMSILGASFSTFEKGRDSINQLISQVAAVRSETQLSAEVVSTSIKTIVQRLQRPEVSQALAGMGIQIRNARGEFVGITGAVEELSRAMKGIPATSGRFAEISELVAGIRQGNVFRALIDSQDQAKRAYESATNGSVALTLAVEKGSDDTIVRLEKLSETWLAVGRAFAETQSWKSAVDIFLKLGDAAASLTSSLKPLLPLAATLGTLALGRRIGNISAGFGAGLLQRHASGGMVAGDPSAGDSQVSLLTGGEYVLQRSAVSRIGLSTLNKMNSGLPRYAAGGPVGYVSPSVANQLGDSELVKQVASFGVAVHSLDQVLRSFVEGQGLVITGIKEQVAVISRDKGVATAKGLSSAQLDSRNQAVLDNSKLVFKVLSDIGLKKNDQRYGQAESLGMEALIRAVQTRGGTGEGFGGYAYTSIRHAIGRQFKKEQDRPEVGLSSGYEQESTGRGPLAGLIHNERLRNAYKLAQGYEDVSTAGVVVPPPLFPPKTVASQAGAPSGPEGYALGAFPAYHPPFVSQFFGAITSPTGAPLQNQLPQVTPSSYRLAGAGSETARLALASRRYGSQAGRFASFNHGDYGLIPSNGDELLAEQDRLIRAGVSSRKTSTRFTANRVTDPLALRSQILSAYQSGNLNDAAGLLVRNRSAFSDTQLRVLQGQLGGGRFVSEGLFPAQPSGFERFSNGASRRIAGALGVSRGAVSSVARGLGRFGASYGAPILSSYAGDFVSGLSGDAEGAVTAGSTGRFTTARAGGGALQGLGLGSAVGASVGGVPGAAVGAVAGALFGLVSSLKDAEKEIRDVKIGNSLADVTNRVADLATNGGASDFSSASSTLKSLRQFREQSAAKNQDEATGFFSGFDSDAFSALQSKSTRHAFGGQLSNLNRGLTEQATAIGKADSGGDLSSLRQKLKEGGNGLNQELLSIVAQVRGVSIGKVIEEFGKSIVSGQRAAISEQRASDVRNTQERASASFGRLTLSVESVADSFHRLSQEGTGLDALFHGSVSAARVGLHSENLNQLGRNDAGALIPLRAISQVGGSAGRGLLEHGTALDSAARALPSLLSNAAGSGEDVATSVADGLRQSLGQSDAANAIISTITHQLDGLGLKVFEEIKTDVSSLAGKLIDEAGRPVKEAGSKIASILEQARGSYASGLVTSRAQRVAIGQTTDNLGFARLGTLRTVNSINAYNAGAPGTALDNLSLSQLSGAQNSRIFRLSRGIGPNATAIGQSLRDTNAQIAGAQRAVDQGPALGPQFQANVDALQRLKEKSADLGEALSHLANSSERTSAAQEKLSHTNEERQARVGATEAFLTSSPAQQAELKRGQSIALGALKRGSFQGLSTQNVTSALGYLNQYGGVTLGGAFGNQKGTDIKNQLLKASGADLPPELQRDEAEAQKQVVQAMKDAESALAELRTTQESLATSFFGKLGENQQAFLSKLSSELSRNSLADVENKIGTVGVERKDLSGLAGHRDVLAGAGIATSDQLRALSGRRGDLEKLANAQQSKLGAVGLFGSLQGKLFGDNPFAAPSQSFSAQLGIDDKVLNSSHVDGRRSSLSADSLSKVGSGVDAFLRSNNLTPDQASRVTGLFTSTLTNNAPTSTGAARDLELRKRLSSALHQGLVTGANSDFALAGKDIDSAKSSLSSIQGVDINAIGQKPEQILAAISAFSESRTTLESLDGKVRATGDEFDKLTARAAALRGAIEGGGGEQVAGFARGGFVPRGTDTVPAMLSPGEFVVNARSAQANAGILNAINYYADGGLVREARTNPGGHSALHLAGAGAYRQFGSAAARNLMLRQYLANDLDTGAMFGAGRADFGGNLRAHAHSLATVASANDVAAARNAFYQATLSSGYSGRTDATNIPQPQAPNVGRPYAGPQNPLHPRYVGPGAGAVGPVANIQQANVGRVDQSSLNLGQSITQFAASANSLAKSIEGIPRSITLQAGGEFHVNVNGAEVLNQLEPGVRDLILSTVNDQLGKHFREHMPESPLAGAFT